MWGDPAPSPHTYALKPSQAKAMENADIVFWIGQELELFLEKPIKTIAKGATVISLFDAHDLVKHPYREGGNFDSHDHDNHDDHDTHKEHSDHHEEENHDDHAHENHSNKHKDDHDDHSDHKHDKHDHDEQDVHIWLDPVNAKVMVDEITKTLSKADPKNAQAYANNQKQVMAKIDQLISSVTNDLASVKNGKYVVFHDAYQYYEKRFNLTATGSITVSPEKVPGAASVRKIKDKIANLKAVCVFSEPQFEPKIVTTVTQGTGAKTGVLDPLGSELKTGPNLYFSLIERMTVALKNCLS